MDSNVLVVGDFKERVQLLQRFKRFLVVSVLSIAVFCQIVIVLLFHSPYTKFKDLWVTTAMATMDHQYLARLFVSDSEIQRIMDENKIIDPTFNTNSSEIQVYNNGSQKIELVPVKGSTYKGYMLIVHNPSKVTLGVTKKLGQKGMKVKDIAQANGAIAAINGGGFVDKNWNGTGGTPLGVLINKGKILQLGGGEKKAVIGFNKKNILLLGNYTDSQIKKLKFRDAVTFTPLLVVNGVPTIKKGNGGQGIQPRTAIGQRKDGTILMLVIDGRQMGYSMGATLKDVQDIMVKFGAHNAANLDGGSSTVLYYNGKIVNKPCLKNGGRNVPSAFLVMP